MNFLSLYAVPHANISIFHGEFQIHLKGEKYHISCKYFEKLFLPYSKDRELVGLETVFCESSFTWVKQGDMK